MKRKTLILAILSVLLVLSVGIGSAWAYFTDTTTASGSLPILIETTTITEENGPQTKTIRIQNTSEKLPVWVRARVYSAEVLQASAAGEHWSGDINNWFYYDTILTPKGQEGDETLPIKIDFKLRQPRTTENPTGALPEDETNVIVVYEAVPVEFDENGEPLPANWKE